MKTNLLSCTKIVYFPIQISAFVTHLVGMLLFTSLMSLGAFIRIPLPFTPVPITLQTLFVFLAGSFLGSTWGASSMILYLLLGTVGLPIFAGANCGILYLFGPTGGYLLGFIIAAWIMGYITSKKHNPSIKCLIIGFVLANSFVYIFGITQLMFWTGHGLAESLFLGLVPFVPGDTIKIIIGILVIKGYKKCFSATFPMQKTNDI